MDGQQKFDFFLVNPINSPKCREKRDWFNRTCHRAKWKFAPGSEVRNCLRLTQTEFAEQILISRESLASYEDARVPLKVGLALKICRQFIISEEWLATGFGHFQDVFIKKTPFDMPSSRLCVNLFGDDISKKLNKNMLFSRAFDEILLIRYEQLRLENPFAPRINMAAEESPSAFQNAFNYLLEVLLFTLDEPSQKKLLATLNRSAQILGGALWGAGGNEKDATAFESIIYDVFLDHQALEEHYNLFLKREARKKTLGNDLTEAEINNIAKYVTSQLPELLERVRKASSASGKKSELAKFLGAPLASVSRWLSGDREPGGEIALKMLHWVLHQERQIKKPGTVTAAPGIQQAQTMKSTHEKHNSSQ